MNFGGDSTGRTADAYNGGAGSGSANGVFKILQSLDLHPKTVKDFAVRTKTGAWVSIASLVLAFLLLVGELRWFLTKEIVEHMEVDVSSRGEKMRVNFDIAFPSLPCAMVSVDAVDASGKHQLEILHDVFKRRLDKDGNPIGSTERGERGALTNQKDLMKEKQRAIADGRPIAAAMSNSGAATNGMCGDCYGAGGPNQCCNTCEEVRTLYKRKGWQFNMDGVEQCKREGFFGDITAQATAKEGCNVYGHLEVPKVPGNLHFAPSHSVQHAYSQVQDLMAFTLSTFNISHRINSLSFGPYYPVGFFNQEFAFFALFGAHAGAYVTLFFS
jgi:endoplasmic reticulum-Golgi intermediate compartment protein 3